MDSNYQVFLLGFFFFVEEYLEVFVLCLAEIHF